MFGLLDYTEELESRLKESQRRIENKKQQLADINNEYELLRHQQFNLLKGNVRYIEFYDAKSAVDGFWMLRNGHDESGKKLDKRRKYPEVESLKRLQCKLRQCLGLDNDIEISSASDLNTGQANIFEFDYKNYTWLIQIPNVDNLEWGAFSQYGRECFEVQLCYQEHRSSWMHFFGTINIRKLEGVIDKKVEELNKENRHDC